MLYQYKNFRTREMINKKMKNESSELFKIVIFLLIINLVLISFYFTEKKKYNEIKSAKYSFHEIKNTDNKELFYEEYKRKDKIIDLLNDNGLCSLCRRMDYNNGSIRIECDADNIDKLYQKIKMHNEIKEDEIEGDSSRFILKLVLK